MELRELLGLTWGALKAAGRALGRGWMALAEYRGGSYYEDSGWDDDDWDRRRREGNSALHSPPNYLPPEAHNGFGTVADFTYGMPED